MKDKTFESARSKYLQSDKRQHVDLKQESIDFEMGWQADDARWRKEFARVTGLGIDATMEETIEHYMDTVNQAVAWRDELAHGREKMKCGHRRANWFHAQSEDEGCCLACQSEVELKAEWSSLLPCGHVRMNLVDLVSEPDIPSTCICLACKAVKEAHGCKPQTAETCRAVPPHSRAYVVEKQTCGRCSRPWPCLDHPAILQEQLINIQRVKVCLVCEARDAALRDRLKAELEQAQAKGATLDTASEVKDRGWLGAIKRAEAAEAKCAEMGKLIEYCQMAFETLAPYREEGDIAFAADEWAKRVLTGNPGQALREHVKALERVREEVKNLGREYLEDNYAALAEALAAIPKEGK